MSVFPTAILTNSPGEAGTSFTVESGQGSRLSTGPATVHPEGTLPTHDTAEVVEITDISTDDLTVTREQKSTTAKDVASGWRITNGIYTDDIASQDDISDFETTTQLNARDTANRDRANHTGTQTISTVSGLQTELDGKIDNNNISAFSAHLSANQSISSSTFTKIQFNTEEYDEGGNYDNTTNYRFTAPVNGIYDIKSMVSVGMNTADRRLLVSIYKNGSEYRRFEGQSATGDTLSGNIQSLMSLAATDYVEIFAWQNTGSSRNVIGGSSFSHFNGHLIRTT